LLTEVNELLKLNATFSQYSCAWRWKGAASWQAACQRRLANHASAECV